MGDVVRLNEKKIVKERVSEKIYKILLKDILNGKFLSGDKLPPERVLAEQFEVHRNSVREALKKLEMTGIISIKHGDGATVKNVDDGNVLLLESILSDKDNITPKILHDLLLLRMMIEPVAARETAINVSEREFSDFLQVLNHEKKYLNIPNEFYKYDFMFHSLIMKFSNNLILQLVINSVKDIYTSYTKIFFSLPEVTEYVYKIHCDIVEAIKNRDEILAENLMKILLEHGEEKLLKMLNGG